MLFDTKSSNESTREKPFLGKSADPTTEPVQHIPLPLQNQSLVLLTKEKTKKLLAGIALLCIAVFTVVTTARSPKNGKADFADITVASHSTSSGAESLSLSLEGVAVLETDVLSCFSAVATFLCAGPHRPAISQHCPLYLVFHALRLCHRL